MKIHPRAMSAARTPLMHAAAFGTPTDVKRLLQEGASVNDCNHMGDTALHEAATYADAGADVNARTQQGITPLMCAAANGKLEVVRLLLSHSADAQLRDDLGDTAADLATQHEYPEIERVLREVPSSV